MKKLPNFKQHGCYYEQKIAYDFLFTEAYIDKTPLNKILKFIDKYYTKQLEKYDILAIKKCISSNYNNYIEHPFTAYNYNIIAERLPL